MLTEREKQIATHGLGFRGYAALHLLVEVMRARPHEDHRVRAAIALEQADALIELLAERETCVERAAPVEERSPLAGTLWGVH